MGACVGVGAAVMPLENHTWGRTASYNYVSRCACPPWLHKTFTNNGPGLGYQGAPKQSITVETCMKNNRKISADRHMDVTILCQGVSLKGPNLHG